MNLKFLNKVELDQRLRSLFSKEKELLQEILFTIKEIDARRLYLDFGYPNLFSYLTDGLGYSEGSAQRRIDGARLLRELPEISHLIQNGEIKLSQVSMLQKATRQVLKTQNQKVTREQKKLLIHKLSQKNYSDSEQVIASFFNLPVLHEYKKTKQADESVRLEITLSKDLFTKIEKAQQLLSHSIPSGDLVKYIEYVTEKVIQAKIELKPLASKLVRKSEPTNTRHNINCSTGSENSGSSSNTYCRNTNTNSRSDIRSGTGTNTNTHTCNRTSSGASLNSKTTTNKNIHGNGKGKIDSNGSNDTSEGSNSNINTNVCNSTFSGANLNSETNNNNNNNNKPDNANHNNCQMAAANKIITDCEIDPMNLLETREKKIPNYIGIRTRRQIFTSINPSVSCCQYKDPVTGKICQSRWYLQLDHKHPRWAKGTHTSENLQILCAAHNRFKYLKEKHTRLIS